MVDVLTRTPTDSAPCADYRRSGSNLLLLWLARAVFSTATLAGELPARSKTMSSDESVFP